MEWADGLRMMAGYNRWMNEKLYALAAKLPDDERKRNRGAFFKSIHGTLNHLLLTDRMWLCRFTGEPPPFAFRSLDQELHADFEKLRAERRQLDAEIEDYCRGLDGARLASTLRYRTALGREFAHELAPALVHWFNHQTHHRGQLTTLLSQAGVDPGVTDALAYYREALMEPR